MRWIRRLLWGALLSLAVAPVAHGAGAVLENEFLRLQLDAGQNAFSVMAKEGGRRFVERGVFTHEIRSATQGDISDPIWGQGREIRLTHRNGWQSSLQLYAQSPFLRLHTQIRNSGDTPYVTEAEEFLQWEVHLGEPIEQLRAFGTAGLRALDEAPGSFSFGAVVDPRTRRGLVAAWLTHERGSGIILTEVQKNTVQMRARLDFGRLQVDPGQSRPTDTLVLGYFDDARLGLEAYADAVVRQYAIGLRPMPTVYCTWYHAGASTEEKLLANARFAQTHLKPFGFSVMQIDDHWQARFPRGYVYQGSENDLKDGGPIKVFFAANDNYPHGMEFTADQIRALGLVPGLWFMPFAGNWKNPYFADKQDLFAKGPDGKPFTTRWSGTILDLTNPKTQAFVRQRVKRIADWGFGYFKLDGLHTGAACHNVYVNTGYSTSGPYPNKKNFGGSVLHDPRKTHIEAYRTGLKIVRETAPEVFLLGCNVSQNMRSMGAAFGLIDAMRIGPDNGGAARGQWNQVTVGAFHGSSLYFLNGRVWHNDPDPAYVRPATPLESARLMVSWAVVSGSMLTTSYQFSELPEERLDILKRAMPAHGLRPRPADLFEAKIPRIWLLTDTRRNVRRDVIGLFNWKEREPDEITYDLAKLGLSAETRYVAYDFWADAFVDVFQGTLVETLPPGTCRILAIRPQSDHPQLLSTSRHITQGIVDVLEEHWDPSRKELSGASQLVAGDPYELRIALPAAGAWTLGPLAAEGAQIRTGESAKHGVRVVIESAQSQTVRWKAQFSTHADAAPR